MADKQMSNYLLVYLSLLHNKLVLNSYKYAVDHLTLVGISMRMRPVVAVYALPQLIPLERQKAPCYNLVAHRIKHLKKLRRS